MDPSVPLDDAAQEPEPPVLPQRERPAFAHASEAELARILDFYQVEWAYEPHTFPILFDRSGAVLESFSPDFYLPEMDLYVELTTLKQRLVRKKNRKLRRLRELYPAIRVKLLYARDFRALLFKYGRLALADGLSGTDGQTTPPRDRTAASDAVAEPALPATDATSVAPAVAPALMPHEAAPTIELSSARRRTRRTRSEARARALARAAMEVSA